MLRIAQLKFELKTENSLVIVNVLRISYSIAIQEP